jgi:hypothetical protein
VPLLAERYVKEIRAPLLPVQTIAEPIVVNPVLQVPALQLVDQDVKDLRAPLLPVQDVELVVKVDALQHVKEGVGMIVLIHVLGLVDH